MKTGENFSFRIELSQDEAKEMLAVMADQSDLRQVEKHLTDFDWGNKDRRVILDDEQERWVA